MDELLTRLLTADGDITLLTAAGLIVLAGFTSLITASLGIGGGVLLLAVMATTVPVAALIPLHGLVQLGSNGNRAVMTRRHIDWKMLIYFSLGALPGALLASLVVVQLPLVVIQYAVAGFILFLVWGSKPQVREMSPLGRMLAGAVTTLVAMFVGATGPLVAAFVHRNGYSKMQITATFASCMTFQNILKAVVFTAVGFQFFAWLGLISAMVLSGFIGTWAGLKILSKIPPERFLRVFRWIVTLLALKLIWEATLLVVSPQLA